MSYYQVLLLTPYILSTYRDRGLKQPFVFGTSHGTISSFDQDVFVNMT